MGKVLEILSWIANRLKEPSTMASIASIGALVHVNVDPGVLQYSVDIFSSATALLGVVLKEKGE